MQYNFDFCKIFAKTAFLLSIPHIIPRRQSTAGQRNLAQRAPNAHPTRGPCVETQKERRPIRSDARSIWSFTFQYRHWPPKVTKLHFGFALWPRRGLQSRAWGTAQRRAGSHRTATGNHREPHDYGGELHGSCREPAKRSGTPAIPKPTRPGTAQVLHSSPAKSMPPGGCEVPLALP